MKKRNTTALIILLICLMALNACGKSASYANNVSVSAIADSVDAAIGKDDGSLVSVDESYISGSMQMDVSGVSDYVVKINAYGANIDEYGIFKGADTAQTKELASAVESYLQMRNDTWMTEYMPEEHPKMESASYVTVGNYVMYAILDDDVKQTAFDTLESCLTEG
jgi:hypothetical protein